MAKFKRTRGKMKQPVRTVIYGQEGCGKTTLAAQWPEPLFIDTENGSNQLDVERLEPPTSWQMMLDEIDDVLADPEGVKTLVIDTIDRAETMLSTQLIKEDGKGKSIETIAGGYGKGPKMLAERVQRDLLNRLDKLIAKGINIVLVAHSVIQRFSPPDADPYDRWETNLSKYTSPIYKQWADLLIFCEFQTIVTKDDDTKRSMAQGGRRRVMHCNHTATYDGKNRYGLDKEEYPLDYKILKPIIDGQVEKKPERTQLDINAENKGIVDADNPIETTAYEAVLKKLEEAGITEEQFLEFMNARGYGDDQVQYSENLMQSVLDSIDATIKVIKKGEK